jgi:hypothetical protein
MNLSAAVRRIAQEKAMPEPVPDYRPTLWIIAQAHANDRVSARTVMATLSWLYYQRGVRDQVVLERIARRVARAQNPYAYLQPGGRAIEAAIGECSVERAEADHEAEKKANLRFLGTSR